MGEPNMKPWSDKQLRTFANVLGLGGQVVGGLLILAAMVGTVIFSDKNLGIILLFGICLFLFGQVQGTFWSSQLQFNELKRRLEALEAGRSLEKPTQS